MLLGTLGISKMVEGKDYYRVIGKARGAGDHHLVNLTQTLVGRLKVRW